MVYILDSTLREGEQTPGVAFPPHIKLALARKLDQIGVDFIEVGHPAVSEEIAHVASRIASLPLRAGVAAHARTLIHDVDQALECGANFLGVFYCVSDSRAKEVFNRDVKDAIDNIVTVIAYAKEKNPDLLVRYTPEDTVRSRFENVVAASVAAVEAGADIISIADTTGHMVPGLRSMHDYVHRLKDALAARGATPMIAAHCHNDRGLALANALEAYRAGADIIDVSVLSLGERAGIVDLAQLLASLALDWGEENRWALSELTSLYDLVSLHSRMRIPSNAPIVGSHAFTHCAGVHTHAAVKNPLHYESLSPEPFGRERRFALDHMSGIASVQFALEQIQVDPDRAFSEIVLKQVKAVGLSGRLVDLEELKWIVDWCRHHEDVSLHARTTKANVDDSKVGKELEGAS